MVPMFMQPQAVPVARIVANLEKQLKQKPKDATLHYTLARALYLSVVNESALIPAYGERLAPRHLAKDFLMQRRYFVSRHTRDAHEGPKTRGVATKFGGQNENDERNNR